MKDMFTNYGYIPEGYIPNNSYKEMKTPCSYTKLNPIHAGKPYELYNAKGELEGYFWHYGDSINLEFSIIGEVTLDGNGTGNYINAEDFLKDKKITIQLYNFRLDPVHTFTTTGIDFIENSEKTKCATIGYIDGGTAFSDSSDLIEVDPVVILSIDSKLSQKLVKGVYFCSLTVSGAGYHETIFSPSDCKLLVK